MTFDASLWMCQQIFKGKDGSSVDAMTQKLEVRMVRLVMTWESVANSPSAQALQDAGVLQVSRTVATNVLYDMRLEVELDPVKPRFPPLPPVNKASYDALMVLHRSGRLAFSLETIVNRVVKCCSRGAVE